MEQGLPQLGRQQPNFETSTGGFDALSQQFALCANLPAVDGGARLQDTLQAILQQLATLNRGMRELDRKVEVLDRKVNVTNKNSMARVENSIVIRGEMALAPLYSPRTGEEIPNCPPTLADLEGLSAQEAAAMLRELDELIPRASEQRMRQLKLAFGLRKRAV